MARLPRVVAPGYPHHVTQRGNRREQTFFGEDDYREYLSLLVEWCRRHGVRILAYCLMPNHVHLILVPPSENGLCRAIGELTVWVEQGPHAGVAGVIRGSPPQEVRGLFTSALEAIGLELGQALADFSGDVAPFEAASTHLRACLVQAQQEAERRKRSVLLWVLPAVVALGLGWWGFVRVRGNMRWSDYLQRLDAEPGIVVTRAERAGGKYVVRGLRDPMAKDPREMLTDAGLDPSDVEAHWERYHALDPAMILMRARAVLDPPAGVRLAFDGGVLSASGTAGREWIQSARRRAGSIPGVDRYRDDGLVAADADAILLARARAALKPLDTVRLAIKDGVLHASGTAPGTWIVEARGRASRQKGLEGIRGYDDSGLINQELQALTALRDRIDKCRLHFGVSAPAPLPQAERKLTALAADPGAPGLTAVGKGAGEPAVRETTEQDRSTNRRVAFRVILSKSQGG